LFSRRRSSFTGVHQASFTHAPNQLNLSAKPIYPGLSKSIAELLTSGRSDGWLLVPMNRQSINRRTRPTVILPIVQRMQELRLDQSPRQTPGRGQTLSASVQCGTEDDTNPAWLQNRQLNVRQSPMYRLPDEVLLTIRDFCDGPTRQVLRRSSSLFLRIWRLSTWRTAGHRAIIVIVCW
jgi:hypothetical protein